MADFNSSLPIRTENAGDAIVKVADATVTSQQLKVESDGSVHARLADSTGTAITSQASGAQRALDVGINVAGVQVDPRQIRTLTSSDVVTSVQGTAAAIAGAWPVKPTDGTNSQSYTASGEAKVQITQPLPAGTNALGSVNADIRIAGSAASASNPVPVTVVSSVPGSSIQNYQTSASLAAGATVNLTYTVTAGKTLSLARVWSSASGKIKAIIEVETGVGTGIYTTKMVGFNSTSYPNIDMTIVSAISVAAGVRVQVSITNEDKQPFDVYTTIEGTEN